MLRRIKFTVSARLDEKRFAQISIIKGFEFVTTLYRTLSTWKESFKTQC